MSEMFLDSRQWADVGDCWPGISAIRLDRDGTASIDLTDGRSARSSLGHLTAAAGYCDYVVSERAHAAHITNASRRLGRADNLHRCLQSLVQQL